MKILATRFSSILALLFLPVLWMGGERCLADAPLLNTTSQSSAEGLAAMTVRSIAMPHFEPALPVEPGRREFMAVCIGCHSPRYVTMQPPFSRRQWEVTVVKMVKTYGAPADEKQVNVIVDYLETIDGTEPQAPAKASDLDDDGLGPVSNSAIPPDPEPVPVLSVATNAEEQAAAVRRGGALFLQDCSGCHGMTGRSDGFVSKVLLPKPANLGAAQFSTELLSQVLWDGVPGTAMPSWRSLPKDDLNALAAYVQTLHPPTNPDQPAAEVLSQGRILFQHDCAACHGVSGDGKSAAAAALVPAPTNFRLEQPDADFVLDVLRDGVPGTAMPAMKSQLSESDRLALAGFVRSFYTLPKPSQK